MAKPVGKFYATLYGVSCTSSTACEAVGQSDNGSSSAQTPLAERWNGASSTIQHAITP